MVSIVLHIEQCLMLHCNSVGHKKNGQYSVTSHYMVEAVIMQIYYVNENNGQ